MGQVDERDFVSLVAVRQHMMVDHVAFVTFFTFIPRAEKQQLILLHNSTRIDNATVKILKPLIY